MDATRLRCTRCGKTQPIRFEPLLPGEPSLGTSVCCAQCGEYAFTLLKPARFYCGICDDVKPVLLERVGGDRREASVRLVCCGCFDGKATLYAAVEFRG